MSEPGTAEGLCRQVSQLVYKMQRTVQPHPRGLLQEQINRLRARLSSIRADSPERLARYEEALRWYGDEANYKRDRYYSSAIGFDGGRRARGVLEGKA